MYTDDANARLWATLCHLAALSVFLGVPFGNLLGPLLLWLIKRDEHPFIDEQGKEAVNFQISIIVYAAIFGVGAIVVGVLTLGLALIALVPLAILFLVLMLVLIIIAAVRANAGEPCRYPFTIPFIS